MSQISKVPDNKPCFHEFLNELLKELKHFYNQQIFNGLV